MTPPEAVDLAIVGGGCAGLSLVRELSSRGFCGSVALVEPRLTYQDDRSWCFWAADDHPLVDWVSHSWPHWLFGVAPHAAHARSCEGYAYRYIRSADFYQKSIALLRSRPTMRFIQGQAVSRVDKVADGWSLTIGPHAANSLHAAHVIDTRPPPEERLAQSTLFQCFVGVEIVLEYDQWDDTQAELMTDMRVVDGEFCFTYILPLSPRSALVEVTFFATHRVHSSDIERELSQLLERRGWAKARRLRLESGVLPMGLPPLEAPTSDAPIRAGMGGGALRASSGYGFMRIQRWAALCAQQLVDGDRPIGHAAPSRLLQHMDHLFLDVLASQPALGPVLFDKLFGHVHPERFLRFMDDRPSIIDLLLMVACLPKLPFLNVLRLRISKGRMCRS
jgi:lycopene beta-cyclase